MKVNLVERRQILVKPQSSDDMPKMTVFIHFRYFDDHFYAVQETFTEGVNVPDRVIDTQIQGLSRTQEEVKISEEGWSNLKMTICSMAKMVVRTYIYIHFRRLE